MKLRHLIATLLIVAVALPGSADDSDLPRPVEQEYRLEVGGVKALSTYLSPLRYSGTSWSVSGSWRKATSWNPENMVMQFDADVTYLTTLNPAHTAQIIGATGYFGWGLAWRKRLSHNLQLTAGGALDINGGALYLTRNSNNPVTAMAYAGLDLTASLTWRTHFGRIPVIVGDEVRIPSLGAFFMPEYGETYYEIYLGNHNGLAHCGWWGNKFSINNLLSLRLDFGRTALQVGYRFALDTAHANHLHHDMTSHRFVIAVIPHGLGLKKHKNINSAIY